MKKVLIAIAIAATTIALTMHAQAAGGKSSAARPAAHHSVGRPTAAKPAVSHSANKVAPVKVAPYHGVNKAAPAKIAPNHGVNKAAPAKPAPNHGVNKAAPAKPAPNLGAAKAAPNHHAAPGKIAPNHGANAPVPGKAGVHLGNPGYNNANRIHNYYLQHGTRFAQGYFYRGRNHSHWTVIRFDPRYGCDLYWDPDLGIWFYWCAPDLCFYPVSYVPYRCYVCTQVVITRTIGEASRQTAPCPSCDGETPIVYPSTPAPPSQDDVAPIPEPVLQQSLPARPRQ
jgi:hypothetical protein